MFLIFYLALMLLLGFLLSQSIKKLRLLGDKKTRFNSLPVHYSYCFVLWSLILIAAIFFVVSNHLARFLLIAAFLIGNFFLTRFLVSKNFNSKNHLERLSVFILAAITAIGLVITAVIAVSIFFEASKFFHFVKPLDFLLGTSWNPQMAMTAEQSVGSSSFGIIPVFLGTLLITLIAMIVAVPLGIMAAIYLCFYSRAKTRDYLKPVLEILAGVPTVVYGYFAVIAVAPFFKNFLAIFGLNIASESAIAAGFVMGMMIIPFVLSLTDDALNAVPGNLKDGALALGSTKSEMIKKVALPTAMPSIVGAIILAVSRAIGETMIVVMAAGLIAKLTFNPLDSVTTATAQIVTLLVGDQEFNSPKTLAAFALALTLFIFTFIFNIIALVVIKGYKRKYG